jgi:CheY-like chemotaxis protein
MTLLALLVSSDDSASEVLGRVLPDSGIAVERFSDVAAAVDRLHRQRFDAIILDFEEPSAAAEVLEHVRHLNSGNEPVTVALVAERSRTRELLSGGAHFVLHKPLSNDTARAGLRAVAALLNRERRRAYRVPVQAAVDITLADSSKAEGILLDLSETGMDVLTAEPQALDAQLTFRFQLPDASLEVNAHGRVAWAKENGQTGVRFLDLDESTKAQLQVWVRTAAGNLAAEAEESVAHCKLADLSLGGCYVETDSPFPERALVDLCLKTEVMAVHLEGLVRVTHPGHGMGLEFPSGPEAQIQVGNLISVLRSCPESKLEVSVAPRSLKADLSRFTPEGSITEELEDPLVELLRRGSTLQQDDFLAELSRQRSGESVAT